MRDKPKFILAEALGVASQLVGLMQPHVERIQIAGSIRRCKPAVGDIEILYVPKIRMDKVGLFDENEQVNLTDRFLDGLISRCVIERRTNASGAMAWGPKNKLGRHLASGIPVDFFATTPENWFVSLVIRTGSKESNLALTTGAQRLGRTLNAYGCGVTGPDGTVIPATSERHVFELCGVAYREPHCR